MALKARPTTYRGIAMRSRLEAHFAAFLDGGTEPWAYEPRAFADETGQYLPDFRLGDKTFIEVKPTIAQAEEAMAAMERIWSSVPDATLMVVFGSVPIALVTEGRRWEQVAYPWR